MGQKIIIGEGQYKKMLKYLKEDYNFDNYDDLDWFDAFLTIFKSWIKNSKGEEFLKYPVLFLSKKFGDEFLTDTFNDEELREYGLRDYHGDLAELTRWNVSNVVKGAVRKGIYQLPSLAQEEKFTEKYGPMIDSIMSEIDIPKFITINFTEDEPQKVKGIVKFDFLEWMRYPEKKNANVDRLRKTVEHYLESYLGVEFGNIAHGQTQLTFNNASDYHAQQDFIKTKLNKVIKPVFRNLPLGNKIKAIRTEFSDSGLTLKVVFKDDWRMPHADKNKLINSMREALNEMGYGPNLEVERI